MNEDEEDKEIYYIEIPNKVIKERKTDYFQLRLKKLFVKLHNGNMFVVRIIKKDDNNNDVTIPGYSFEIDKKENIINFTYNPAETEN